jgi:MFS family permease
VARDRRELAWAATVGLVLADSSIVTLALPEILARFGTTVFEVSWVLTSFNVVLGLAVLPAAVVASGRPAPSWAAGVVAFALASLLCAVAGSLEVLLAARCLQALGGAFAIAGAIELLARSRGSHARAAPLWGVAGLAGVAIGPAAGGLLTELISWQAIFAFQVPVALLVVFAARTPRGAAERGAPGRVRLAPELALGLVSAGLTGALFLLVVLLTEGWGRSPLQAALIVTVMPVATVVAHLAMRGRDTSGRAVMAAGAVALAGGLAALGLLPDAEPAWTLAPQALVGAGIALVLPGLTGQALGGADPAGRRAAGTVAARHAGIVLGLLLLTPLFTAELTEQRDAAQAAGTALVLDADLPPRTKIELGREIAALVDASGGEVTDLSPAFERVQPPPEARADYARLEAALEDEVDRAATSAFGPVFLVAGGLALLALIPIGLGAGTRRERGGLAVLAAAGAASAGLIGAQLALGGGSYEPQPVADPCRPRAAQQADTLQRIALSALDGAACRLRVTREELVVALATEESREAFARAHGIRDAELEEAVRAGLGRAIDEEARRGTLSPLEAGLLREARNRVPVGALIDALQSRTGRNVLELLSDLIG